MKKFLFTITLLAGLVMFAGCGNQTPTDTTNETNTETTNPTEETNQENFSSTMKDLYKKGGKMTCTMTSNEEGIVMNGTLYIDGKKMRSEFKGNMEGMAIEMNTIIKDGYSYTRSNMSKEGWKMAEDSEMEEGMNDAATDTDVDTPMNFTCKKGVSGASFDLPAGIEFKEMAY